MSHAEPPPSPSEQGVLAAIFTGVVDRPVAMTMVFLAAVVFGFVSYQRLPVELMPDVSYPTITVRTTFEGAAPQEVETQVSEPIEEALATLDGLVTLESRSRAGNSDVVLGFDWNTDMGQASQAVREALQTVWLPDGTERPLILRYDPSLEPFLRLALSYDPEVLDMPPEEALFLLRDLAEREIQRRLEALDGVAAVRVNGGLEREFRVEVREDWLAARKLTLDEVRQALAAENVNLAGGSVLEGDTEYLVRTLNEVRTVEDLRALRIRRSDGVLVPLTDVAIVREVPKERQVVGHLGGAEAVELEIFKEADANVVRVAERVKKVLHGTPPPVDPETLAAMPPSPRKDLLEDLVEASKGLEQQLPAGVKLAVLDDQASFIEEAVANLREAVIVGGLLSILVVWAFLRDARATAIIGLALPISLLVAFAPLHLLGSTLNLMSLGGLALGVGNLVDNAVVVLESAQVYIDRGMNRRRAVIRGTAEIAAAVTASTLTSIAVFVPIGLVEGIGGELFGDLSLAVVSSVLASLAVALFLVPTLVALGDGRPAEVADEGPAPDRPLAVRAVVAPVVGDLRASWAAARARPWRFVLLPWALLRFALALPWAVVTEILRAVVVRGGRLVARVVRKVGGVVHTVAWHAVGPFLHAFERFASGYERLMPTVLRRPGTVIGAAVATFLIALQIGANLGTELIPELHQGRLTIDAALPVGTPLERTVEVIAEAEARIGAHPDVEVVYARVGSDGRAEARADEGEHSARLRVQLKPDLSAVRQDEVMDELRHALDGLGLTVQVSRPSLFSFRTPLEVVIFGRDLDRLRETGDHLVAALEEVPGLTDVRTSLATGHPEIRISYDRERLARFGLDTATVAARVRDRVQGVEATEIRDGDRRIDLRVQLVEAQRSSVDDLRRLNVNPNVVPPIPLDAVATFTEALGPSEIRRVDRQRAVVLSANVAGFDLGGAVERMQQVVASAPLDADMRWDLGGQARELDDALGSLMFALGLAVFLVYVIMAITFEHLVHPFVILFSVPLALIGVVGGLALWGLPMSVMAALGLIVLAGVVVNNAIVLVDAINRLRDEGVPRLEAITRAAATRLRPILITTGTTVLGLLPLLLGIGAGAELQQPLGVTVVGGLVTSTLLTLGVVPVVYALATGGLRPDPAPAERSVDAA